MRPAQLRPVRLAAALLLFASPAAFAGPAGKSEKAFTKDATAGVNGASHTVAKPVIPDDPALGADPAAEKSSPAKGTKPKGKPKLPPAAAQGFLVDTTGARALSGRVPRGYGALNLTQPQKERIYGIQAVYDAKVKELEATIERLKAEEAVQIESVLLPPQRAAIERYKAMQALK
jgi:hypothetical protein